MPDVHVGGKHTFPKDDKKDRMYAVKAHLAPGRFCRFVYMPFYLNRTTIFLFYIMIEDRT